jgi:hypothetical protein
MEAIDLFLYVAVHEYAEMSNFNKELKTVAVCFPYNISLYHNQCGLELPSHKEKQ